MEGARALAAHYRFTRLLTMDIGGTTTDIGLIENDAVRAHRRGEVQGVATSFPLLRCRQRRCGRELDYQRERRWHQGGTESVAARLGRHVSVSAGARPP